MLNVRMTSLVLLLLGLCLFAPLVKADDELFKEYRRILNAQLCTDTFFECAAVSRIECDQLVDDSISSCPTEALEKALLVVTDNEEAEEEVIYESRNYALCYSKNLQRIIQKRDISEDCAIKAVVESGDTEREKARALLESRRSGSSK